MIDHTEEVELIDLVGTHYLSGVDTVNRMVKPHEYSALENCQVSWHYMKWRDNMAHRDEIRAYQEAGDDTFAPSTGGCLQQALKSLGVDVEVDELFPFDELESLTKSLGLRYFGAQERVAFLATSVVCIIYETDEERMLHAETMSMRHAQTEGLLVPQKLRAIITR